MPPWAQAQRLQTHPVPTSIPRHTRLTHTSHATPDLVILLSRNLEYCAYGSSAIFMTGDFDEAEQKFQQVAMKVGGVRGVKFAAAAEGYGGAEMDGCAAGCQLPCTVSWGKRLATIAAPLPPQTHRHACRRPHPPAGAPGVQEGDALQRLRPPEPRRAAGGGRG